MNNGFIDNKDYGLTTGNGYLRYYSISDVKCLVGYFFKTYFPIYYRVYSYDKNKKNLFLIEKDEYEKKLVIAKHKLSSLENLTSEELSIIELYKYCNGYVYDVKSDDWEIQIVMKNNILDAFCLIHEYFHRLVGISDNLNRKLIGETISIYSEFLFATFLEEKGFLNEAKMGILERKNKFFYDRILFDEVLKSKNIDALMKDKNILNKFIHLEGYILAKNLYETKSKEEGIELLTNVIPFIEKCSIDKLNCIFDINYDEIINNYFNKGRNKK